MFFKPMVTRALRKATSKAVDRGRVLRTVKNLLAHRADFGVIAYAFTVVEGFGVRCLRQ